ncbi:MAG TPA: hypothetical protein VGO93_28900 [Candidatus Xenobia bacterium]
MTWVGDPYRPVVQAARPRVAVPHPAEEGRQDPQDRPDEAVPPGGLGAAGRRPAGLRPAVEALPADEPPAEGEAEGHPRGGGRPGAEVVDRPREVPREGHPPGYLAVAWVFE